MVNTVHWTFPKNTILGKYLSKPISKDHPKSGAASRGQKRTSQEEKTTHSAGAAPQPSVTWTSEARLLSKISRDSLDPLLRDRVDGVRGPHEVTLVKDLVPLDARLHVPHGGRAGELDLGLGGEGPGVLRRGEAGENVAGVVCV